MKTQNTQWQKQLKQYNQINQGMMKQLNQGFKTNNSQRGN